MSVTVTIELGYEFDVKASAKAVFDVLADVPASASHFPQVEQLTDLGDQSYRWEMEKIGLPQINLQTVYACRYTATRSKGTVVWVPIDGIGNALVSGNWNISNKRKFTNVVLHITADITLPLPSLMQVVLQPVLQAEFERLVEQYIDNLIRTFGGEV